jgi:hypothetical protein
MGWFVTVAGQMVGDFRAMIVAPDERGRKRISRVAAAS